MRQDPPGHQGHPRARVLRGLREVHTKPTCGHRTERVAGRSGRSPAPAWRPAPGPTVNLHVDESRRQNASSAVPLLVRHAPLLKEQLLRVQDAAPAHPEVLPADRAAALASRAAPSRPPPAAPHAHLSSAPPRRMRQLVNWSTGARAAPCPPRMVSRHSRAT